MNSEDEMISRRITDRRRELLQLAFRPRRLSPKAIASGEWAEDLTHPLERQDLDRGLKPAGEPAD